MKGHQIWAEAADAAREALEEAEYERRERDECKGDGRELVLRQTAQEVDVGQEGLLNRRHRRRDRVIDAECLDPARSVGRHRVTRDKRRFPWWGSRCGLVCVCSFVGGASKIYGAGQLFLASS